MNSATEYVISLLDNDDCEASSIDDVNLSEVDWCEVYEHYKDVDTRWSYYVMAIIHALKSTGKKDIIKEVEYLERAAELGCIKSTQLLAHHYHTNKMYEKAIYCYSFAIQLELPGVYFNCASLYRKGYGTKKDIHTAIKYYKISASNGNTDSMNALGFIYATGEGLPQNISEAKKYFKIAIDNGHVIAKENVEYFESKNWCVCESKY